MAYVPKQLGTQRDPAKTAFAVTPSDTDEIQVGRAVYVGTGGGDLTVVMANDLTNTPITFANVNSGSLLPLEVRMVMSTGTSVSDIVVVQ